MSYTIESKKDAVIQSVLLTTKQTFAITRSLDQPSNSPALTKTNTEVYFQIED